MIASDPEHADRHTRHMTAEEHSSYAGEPDRVIYRAAQSGDPVAQEIVNRWPEGKQQSVGRKVHASQHEWCISAFDGEVKRAFRCPKDSLAGNYYCPSNAADYEDVSAQSQGPDGSAGAVRLSLVKESL